MKTILFLAVLLFAAQSSPLHEIYRGFIFSLPMKSEVQNQFMNSGLNCLNDLEGVVINLIKSLQRDIPSKHYIDLLRNVLVADDILEHKIAPECLAVYQELIKFFIQNRLPVPGEAEKNGFKTLMYFVQAQVKGYEVLANFVADIIDHQFYHAGERLAYIPKMLAGMEIFEFHFVENKHLNASFSSQKFVYEFIPGLLQEIGANSYRNNQTISCLFDLVNTTVIALSNPSLHRGDGFTATHAFLEGALQITDSVQRCSEKVDLYPVLRVIRLFANYPVHFTGKVLINELLNLTADFEAQNNCRIHMMNGDYHLAGREFGKSLKIVLNGLAF